MKNKKKHVFIDKFTVISFDSLYQKGKQVRLPIGTGIKL